MQNYLQAKQEFAKGLNEYGYNVRLKIYISFFLALMFVYQKTTPAYLTSNLRYFLLKFAKY